MFLEKLMKQRRTPWIGAMKDTLGAALWWGVPVNFAMIAGTFYYTTARHIIPWATPLLFFAAVAGAISIALIMEYKFVLPSVWSFRERQMFGFKSEVIDRIGKLEEALTEAGVIPKKEKEKEKEKVKK